MFDTNRAFVGGALGTAIYSSNRYFDIQQSTFHANVGQGRGGAIYLNGPASGVTLRDVTFYQNTANNGGALSLSEGAGVRMINVQGFENVANKGSGGFLFAKLASNMALQHVYLYNQTSIGGKGGGAIAVYQSKILLDNVTIEKCNAFAPGTVVAGERRSFGGDAANGGAVLLDEGADGEIFNSMFDSNSANDGSGGHVHSNAASLVVHDIVSFFSVPLFGSPIVIQLTNFLLSSCCRAHKSCGKPPTQCFHLGYCQHQHVEQCSKTVMHIFVGGPSLVLVRVLQRRPVRLKLVWKSSLMGAKETYMNIPATKIAPRCQAIGKTI
jgi:hypothetical protein